MTNEDFINDYNEYLQANINPERAAKEKAYLYSDLKHFGLAFGLRSKFFNRQKPWLKTLHKEEYLELVDSLWSQTSFEEKMLALDIIVFKVDLLSIEDMTLIERLIRESRGWALLDNFVIQIMPTLLEKDKRVYSYLRKWIVDQDFWVRRSALLSQLLFFRRGKGGDKDLFFKMAHDQFDESWIDKAYPDPLGRKRAKFFIRKAIGWALREMSKKQPQVVFDYLKANKQMMSGLTFREGSRKLPLKMQAELKMD